MIAGIDFAGNFTGTIRAKSARIYIFTPIGYPGIRATFLSGQRSGQHPGRNRPRSLAKEGVCRPSFGCTAFASKKYLGSAVLTTGECSMLNLLAVFRPDRTRAHGTLREARWPRCCARRGTSAHVSLLHSQ